MAPRADYILPKTARVGCWILAGLFFYALYTRGLLADVALVGHEDFYFNSAWTALGNAVWQNPKSIAVIAEHPDFDKSLQVSAIPAAIGILPLVILALGRKRPLVGFVLLVSILPASLAVFLVGSMIGYWNSHDYLLTRACTHKSLRPFAGWRLLCGRNRPHSDGFRKSELCHDRKFAPDFHSGGLFVQRS